MHIAIQSDFEGLSERRVAGVFFILILFLLLLTSSMLSRRHGLVLLANFVADNFARRSGASEKQVFVFIIC